MQLIILGWHASPNHRVRNFIKVIICVLISGAGALVYFYYGNPEGDSIEKLGYTFFETGVVFLVSRFFLLKEDAEIELDETEKKLRIAEKSAATGLAAGYFHNFLQKIHDIPATAKIEGQDYKVLNRKLWVVIPSDLTETTSTGKMGAGRPLVDIVPCSSTESRPIRAPVAYINRDTHEVNGLYDVPTTLTALVHRNIFLTEQETRIKSSSGCCGQRGKSSAVQIIPVSQEVTIFTNTLLDLLEMRPELNDLVQIVSVPPTPLDQERLLQAIADVASTSE
ncbi:hypothetical protein Pelo_8614 [Pelomyxa schiedti]|nr:hypothetical protein Pelo_8614 [Pelomyxa schiedti]